jgi:hypothetical protein
MTATTAPEHDTGGTELRLSTGMAIRVREVPEEVVARLDTAGQRGATGILTLTREEGTLVHVVAGHVVLIEPKPAAGEPLSEPVHAQPIPAANR